MILDMGGGIHVEFTNPGWDPDHTDSVEGHWRGTLGQDDKTYKGAGVLANLSGQADGEAFNYHEEQSVTSDARAQDDASQDRCTGTSGPSRP